MEGWRAGAEWWRVWLLGTGQKGELHPQLWRDQDFGTRTPHWRRMAGAGPGGQGWGAGPVRGPQGADGGVLSVAAAETQCSQAHQMERSAHRLTRWGDTLGGGAQKQGTVRVGPGHAPPCPCLWGRGGEAKRPC